MKILIVCSCFPPDHNIGARRWGLLAAELAEEHSVSVIKMGGVFALDHDRRPPEGVSVNEVGYIARSVMHRWLLRVRREPGVATASRPSRAVAVSRLARLKESLRFYLNYPCSAWRWANKVAEEGIKIARSGGVDLVIGSSPHISCLRAASKIAADAEVPWIADFRDPYAWYGSNPYADGGVWHRLTDVLEGRLLTSAAAVTAVNEELLGFLRINHEKSRSIVVKNPSSRPQRRPIEGRRMSGGSTVICYAGTLGARYRGASFFSYFSEYLRTNGSQLQFHYCGGSSGRVMGLAEEAGVAQHVKDLGMLASKQVETEIMGADLLLVLGVDVRAEEFFESGKIVEYLFSGRPIIAVGGEKSDALRRVMRETGAGWFVDSPESFGSAVKAYRSGDLPRRNEAAIEAYYPVNAVKPLRRLIEELVGN